MSKKNPVYAFFVSWNRPLYLWACLDGFYKNTTYPVKYVIADNASSDPLVAQVIQGFQRRGMFEAVHYYDYNDPNRLTLLLKEYKDKLHEYYVYIDTDVLVQQSDPCWLSRFVKHMEYYPKLGLLGSLIDTSDFIDIDKARKQYPDIPERILRELIKADSPERTLKSSYKEPIIEPFNPPGRLCMARSETIDRVVIGNDYEWYVNMKQAGYLAGIATNVIHRHLSLLHIYDYPEYDVKARAMHHWMTGKDA